MTLHQWTRVLLEARQTVPWLTLVCWHALGFRANNVNELRSFVRWAALPDYFTSSGASLTGWNNDLVRAHAAVHEEILLYGSSANSTLVLLRRGNSPMTASWRPRADGATLIVTAKELQAIITPLSAPSVAFELPSTPESVCAVEMDPEIPLELSTVQLPAIKYLLRGSARLINVYPPDYAREMRPPLIAAPTDASAVMKAAQLSSQTMP